VEEGLRTEEEVDGEEDEVRRGATITKVSQEIGDKRKRPSPNHSLTIYETFLSINFPLISNLWI
jgi:hypothetical protein